MNAKTALLWSTSRIIPVDLPVKSEMLIMLGFDRSTE
jgi:hypothetical protein